MPNPRQSRDEGLLSTIWEGRSAIPENQHLWDKLIKRKQKRAVRAGNQLRAAFRENRTHRRRIQEWDNKLLIIKKSKGLNPDARPYEPGNWTSPKAGGCNCTNDSKEQETGEASNMPWWEDIVLFSWGGISPTRASWGAANAMPGDPWPGRAAPVAAPPSQDATCSGRQLCGLHGDAGGEAQSAPLSATTNQICHF